MIRLLVVLLGALVAALGLGGGRPDRPVRPAVAVVASCSQQTTEVFYTVPASATPLAISTSLGGVPLASWTEPAGPGRPPVVIGLPDGLDGKRFTVVEGARSATVLLPHC